MDTVICSQVFPRRVGTGPTSVLWSCLQDKLISLSHSAQPQGTAFRLRQSSVYTSTEKISLFLVFHLIKLVTAHGGLAAAAQSSWICMKLFSVEKSRGSLLSPWPLLGIPVIDPVTQPEKHVCDYLLFVMISPTLQASSYLPFLGSVLLFMLCVTLFWAAFRCTGRSREIGEENWGMG